MMLSSSVADCELINLPKITTEAGSITPIDRSKTLPFHIRRVYYLYDVPGGEARGGHAHRELYQLIVAGSGSFDVVIDDGGSKRIINLNRPYFGLLIVPGIWRELMNFSSGSICLVLASAEFNEADYIREYNEFLRYKNR